MSVMDKITRYLIENEATPKIEFRITDDHTELRIVRAGVTRETKVKFYWGGKFHVAGEALTARNKGSGVSIVIIDQSTGERSIAERYIRNQRDGIWGLNNAQIYSVESQDEFFNQLKSNVGGKDELDDEKSSDEDSTEDIPMGDESGSIEGTDQTESNEDESPEEEQVKKESVKPKYNFGILKESSQMARTTEDFIADRYNKSAMKLKRNGVYVEPNKDGIRIIFESKNFTLSNRQITELSKICPSGVTRNDFLISLSSEW